ncbi:MAG: IS481 family transposase [Acidimicrobiia bacterium]
MTHARSQHPNAVLTPTGRRRMVRCVLGKGWTIEATAERFQVDAKTVRKWRDRFVAEGEAGLVDRSSRPRRSPNRTPRACRREVIRLRKKRRWGADHIAHEVGLAPSTAQSILRQAGLGRLDVGDRATASVAPRRYQRDMPGELVHVDVKKLAGIPLGGGWKVHGRGNDGHGGHSGVGYRYLHTAVDDRTRLAYSEILDNEQGETAASFWNRAHAWLAAQGIAVQRVLTDNGACYRSRVWRAALADAGVAHRRTRPYRTQTNGKVERFHRILLEEWAYIRDWTSDDERRAAYHGFMHFYNHHRSHGALGWATPASTLNRLLGDNLPAEHS